MDATKIADLARGQAVAMVTSLDKSELEKANLALAYAFAMIHEATGEEEIKILKRHGVELWSTRHREYGLAFEVYNCRTEEPFCSRLFSEAYENFNAQVVTETAVASKP